MFKFQVSDKAESRKSGIPPFRFSARGGKSEIGNVVIGPGVLTPGWGIFRAISGKR